MGKGCEDTCVPHKCSLKGDVSRGEIQYQVDRMTHSVDIPSLSPADVTAQWAGESGHGGRDGVMRGFDNMDFRSLRLTAAATARSADNRDQHQGPSVTHSPG